MSGTVLNNLGLTSDVPAHGNWLLVGHANERRLDALVQAAVIDERNDPPGSPTEGDRYLIGATPTGAWAGHAGDVAVCNANLSQWDKFTPKPGWTIYNEATRSVSRFHDDWVDTGSGGSVAVYDVTTYGAKGDGVTDDSVAVKAALAAVPAGSRLHFPSGTYLLSTGWTTPYALSKALWISGDGMGNSKIKGAGSVGLFANSANFHCSDITIDTFAKLFDFSTVASVLDKIVIENVEALSFASVFYASSSTPNVGYRGLVIRNCRFATGTNIAIYGNVNVMERIHIRDNEILDVVSKGMDFGSNSTVFADDRGEYLIEGNIIDGVRTTGASSHGILVYGWRAVITNNVVRNIVRTPTIPVPTDSDCDGIYTKCRYSIIANNLCVDAGQAEGFINVKGGAKNETVIQPFGYTAIVANNILLDTQSKFNNYSVDTSTDTFTALSLGAPIAHGMSVGETIRFSTTSILPAPLVADTTYYVRTVPTASTFTVSTTTPSGALLDITTAGSGTQGVTRFPVLSAGTWKRTNGIKLATSEVMCVNNYIEGMCEPAIYFDSDSGSDGPSNNLVVRGNTIKNTVGRTAISIFGRGSRITISENRIDTVHGIWAGGQTMGIDLSNKEGSDLEISRNRITNIVANGGTPIGISLSPSSLSKTYASTAGTPGYITTVASDLTTPSAHAFSVNDPLKFIDIGAGLPTGIVSGTIYYLKDVLDANRFTVSATPGGTALNLSTTAGSTSLAYKLVTFSGWTIQNNYIDGAKYGIQVTYNEAFIAVDQVYMLHNMGRNINSITIPVASDLVHYSDTPTNLIDIPASAAGGVPAVIISGANLGVMKDGTNPNTVRIYSNESTPAYLSLEGNSSQNAINSFGHNLELQISGTRAALITASSLQPNVSNAQDLGAVGNQWRNLWLTGNLVMSGAGKTVTFDQTNTATVGAVTISKMCGSVIVASGASSVVLTNNILSATAHVFCTLRTADGANFIKSVVYSATPSPQVTITLNAAAGANLTVDFVMFS